VFITVGVNHGYLGSLRKLSLAPRNESAASDEGSMFLFKLQINKDTPYITIKLDDQSLVSNLVSDGRVSFGMKQIAHG